MYYRLVSKSVFVSATIALSCSALAAPQHKPQFLFVSSKDPLAVVLPDHAKLGSDRVVNIDAAVLAQPALRINLAGNDLILRRDRTVDLKGSQTWAGHIEGEATSEAYFTRHGDAISGTVRRGNALYEISGNSNGRAVLFEVDLDRLPPDAHPDAQPSGNTTSEPASSAATAAAATGPIHDLMVVYTQATCDRYDASSAGGNADGICSEIESRIVNAVDMANQAYLNSQNSGNALNPLILPQLNLVRMQKVTYTETGNMDISLDDLTFSGGSYVEMDEVQGWRNNYGADLVSLVTEDSNYCGIAWLLNGSSSYGYSVVYSSCLSSQTLAHEIGHNQGNHHDRDNGGSGGYYAYSYGYRNCTNESTGFRTIMAYPCSYNGNGANVTRISSFSNPNVYYNGVSTGINQGATNSAYNALSMNNTSSIVANFRASAATTLPNAPTALNATAASYSRIDLVWTDNADNESGFRIERSLDGSNWSEIATLGANIQTYSNTGLSPQTDYYYRIRAYNSLGNSAYTSVASAKTPAQPAAIDYTPVSETNPAGTVTNSYTAVQNDDGTDESIKEILNTKKAYSYLEHTWGFNIAAPGTSTMLFANAYSGGSTDGDAFNFAYSTNGSTFTNMFTVSSTNVANIQSFSLPASISGTVYVRVTDSNRARNKTNLDTINIDQLYIRVQP